MTFRYSLETVQFKKILFFQHVQYPLHNGPGMGTDVGLSSIIGKLVEE